MALAAIELFEAKGFESTTVAEITARAELSERTFFRYFADKREVLFAGSHALQEELASAVARSTASAALDVVADALRDLARLLEPQREFAVRRARVVSATVELRERELIKTAALGEVASRALVARGFDATTASIATQLGDVAFRLAFEQWTTAPSSEELVTFLDDALSQLRAVAT